jgi:hypothetical protein
VFLPGLKHFPRSSFDAKATRIRLPVRGSWYIFPMKSSMKKIFASVLLLMVFVSPAFAFGFHHHKSQHPHVNHPHRQAQPHHPHRHA